MLRLLKTDPPLKGAAMIFGLVLLPYLLPFLSHDQMVLYGDRLAELPLIATAAVVGLLGAARAPTAGERRFWLLVGAAFVAWGLARLIFLLGASNGLWLDPLADSVYLLFYVCFLIGLEGNGEAVNGTPYRGVLRALALGGTMLLVLGLHVYLAVIPALIDRAEYESWVPGTVLAVYLDLYLLTRLVQSWRNASSERWRGSYGCLVTAMVIWAALDLFDLGGWLDVLPAVRTGTLGDLPRYLPFGFVLIGMRLADPAHGADEVIAAGTYEPLSDPRRLTWGGPLVLYALALPAVHIGAYAVGILGDASRPAREILVAVFVTVAVTMALAFQRLLARENVRLAAERDDANRALREANLRLETCVADRTVELQRLNEALAGDIARREQVEKSLRESEERFRLTLDNSPMMVFNMDRDLRYTWVYNQHSTFSRDRVLGHTDEALFPADQAAALSRIKREVLATGVSQRLEVNLTVNGESRWQDLVLEPMRDARGEIVGLLGVALDITDHKLAEAALRQAQKMEAVGQLTSGVAHDFNNLLTVILTNAELMRLGMPGASDHHVEVQEIEDAARRGASLIRKLLAFSRPEKLSMKRVELASVVDDVVSSLGRLIPETIEVEVSRGRSVPPVIADPSAVQHILVNVMTNARDAMPSGGVIRVEMDEATLDETHKIQHGWGEPGRYARISISDTGVGMDEEIRSRIFEPFFTTKPLGKGSGLGMAMVYGLMKQHHGYVDVESVRGWGTTVSVYMPVASHDTLVEQDQIATPTEVVDLRGTETLLLVEDEAPIRRAAQRVLEQFGYTVLGAGDGEEALRVFEANRERVALVISDVVMPRLTGPELYRAVQRRAPGTKFVMMSGYTSPELQSQAPLDPSLPQIKKPWSIPELLTLVRNVLGGTA